MAALGDDAADQIARRTASLVDRLARAAFARMWAALQAGGDISPRDAIQAVQVQFGGAFAEALAAAFSELLRRSVGVAEVRSMPVGGLSLSRHLYLHNADTSAQVLHLVRQHAAGVHEARALALRLYDGYDPKDGIQRPLEGRARALLPRALRELTADPAARQALARLVEQGQQQAARLKTRALRAGYTEALDAWEAGAGQAALERKLEVAQREKNRYFADRIAQTELARAHQAQVAADLMADDTVDVVQVRINPSHPKADICDLHARADLWGLGPGNYPKARAPRPPFHPHCWCRLRSRPSLSAAGAREVPGGEAAYLRTLAPGEAARVMGSRERLQQLLSGRSAEAVVNDGRDPLYRLARVGDAAGHALVPPGVQERSSSAPRHDIVEFATGAALVADRLVALRIGPVVNPQAILQATGFDLTGFVRTIDNYGVRHTMKQHGSPAKEAARGQLAVTLSDFGLIDLITSEPDRIFYGGKNKIGRDVLVFTKLIDGIGYRHVEEIRSNKKLVATDSLRKKKGAWGS